MFELLVWIKSVCAHVCEYADAKKASRHVFQALNNLSLANKPQNMIEKGHTLFFYVEHIMLWMLQSHSFGVEQFDEA